MCNELVKAGAVMCGHDALEIVRVEAGLPVLGEDITNQNLPQEIGRDEQAICSEKAAISGRKRSLASAHTTMGTAFWQP